MAVQRGADLRVVLGRHGQDGVTVRGHGAEHLAPEVQQRPRADADHGHSHHSTLRMPRLERRLDTSAQTRTGD